MDFPFVSRGETEAEEIIPFGESIAAGAGERFHFLTAESLEEEAEQAPPGDVVEDRLARLNVFEI